MSRRSLYDSKILQSLRHRLQDFARKLVVRHSASHAHRTDERAIREDCSRSCGALALLICVANQSRQQLDIVSNSPGDEVASSLVAACDIPRQSADRAA